MIRTHRRRHLFTLGLFAALSGVSSYALVSFNDGHDKIYVTGNASVAWDSNPYANRDAQGDTLYQYGLKLDYTRRAGAIGVDAGMSVDVHRFQDNSGDNSVDPAATLELTKSGGRTTGSLLLEASRSNEADTSINSRNRSWNYGTTLNLSYPVIERYSLVGAAGWSRRDTIDNSTLFDVDSWYLKTDVFYVLSSRRDLFFGYRYRSDLTTGLNGYNDHDLHVGVKGRILPKLNGSLSLGYQMRQGRRGDDGRYGAWSGVAAATWAVSKKFNLTGKAARDFRTSASDDAIDGLSASLQANYAFTARWSADAGLGVGRSRYLGVHGSGRSDTYFTWQAGLNYSMNDHLKVSAGYVFLRNWSTLSFADYTRNTVSLSVSSRW